MKTLVPYLAASLALTVSVFGASRLEAQINTPFATIISTTDLIAVKVHVVNGYASVLTQRMMADRLKAMNVDRQQHIVSDTNKLVGLATDLHQQMQSDRELAPIELSRRAAEIEKLAHEVQDRMKNN